MVNDKSCRDCAYLDECIEDRTVGIFEWEVCDKYTYDFLLKFFIVFEDEWSSANNER